MGAITPVNSNRSVNNSTSNIESSVLNTTIQPLNSSVIHTNYTFSESVSHNNTALQSDVTYAIICAVYVLLILIFIVFVVCSVNYSNELHYQVFYNHHNDSYLTDSGYGESVDMSITSTNSNSTTSNHSSVNSVWSGAPDGVVESSDTDSSSGNVEGMIIGGNVDNEEDSTESIEVENVYEDVSLRWR
ncbi:putative integral membrane protein [Ehrlichia ruminantium]|uniref:Putative integral membrane protein n=2 Tax=Ehrlichia ruminantium TaxID=779 RepID=A0A170TDD0_EHRRU|nr:putative integral membrane protein [Ehrlichia ruminantium]GAT77620.1 putative integral membrane protein [Ehrlichia ruminantium]GAT78783.1 putative integral membrane protein [Ehrlichia ruminantium]